METVQLSWVDDNSWIRFYQGSNDSKRDAILLKNGDEVIVIKTIRNAFTFEFLESMRGENEKNIDQIKKKKWKFNNLN